MQVTAGLDAKKLFAGEGENEVLGIVFTEEDFGLLRSGKMLHIGAKMNGTLAMAYAPDNEAAQRKGKELSGGLIVKASSTVVRYAEELVEYEERGVPSLAACRRMLALQEITVQQDDEGGWYLENAHEQVLPLSAPEEAYAVYEAARIVYLLGHAIEGHIAGAMVAREISSLLASRAATGTDPLEQ